MSKQTTQEVLPYEALKKFRFMVSVPGSPQFETFLVRSVRKTRGGLEIDFLRVKNRGHFWEWMPSSGRLDIALIDAAGEVVETLNYVYDGLEVLDDIYLDYGNSDPLTETAVLVGARRPESPIPISLS